MNIHSFPHHQVSRKPTRWAVSGVMLVITVLGAPVMTARERVHRLFDQTSGLTVPTVFSLAQDAEGFIWIGTAGGLVRYDGDQMRLWAKDVINRDVFTLLASPNGEVFVAEGTGTLYRVTATGVELVPGPEGKPFREVWSGSLDTLGRLWVVTAEREVYHRERDLSWRRYDLSAFTGERVNVVEPGKDDRVYILTNKAVWLTRGGESPKKLLDVMRPRNVVEHPDGSLFILAWQVDGEIIELRDGRAVNRVSVPARPIDMALRGGVVWGSFSHYLVALRGDEPPDMIGPESDLPSGGPLLVDHEGSLWVGTFGGLVQYPEPETTIWSQKDGLSGSHTRTLGQTEEGIWVGIWGDLSRISREGNEWRVYNERLDSLPCIDQNGELLIGAPPDGVMQRRDGRFVKYSSLPAGDARLHSCTRARDGTLLFTTGRGLFAAQPDRSAPKLLSTPSGDDGQPVGIHRILEDGEKLWAGTLDGRICHGNAPAILAGQTVSWSCQVIGKSVNIFDFFRHPDGATWMSTNAAGIWLLRGERWEQMPVSQSLASQIMFNLTPSPTGGVWLVGQGTSVRVVEQGGGENWEVVEVLSPWEGLPGSGAGDLIEGEQGEVWLATSLGVVRVPAEARLAEAAAPRVKLVDIVINGMRSSTAPQAAELPHRSQVELHFAALSYRDRGRLRYQYRLRSDATWTDSRDSAPVLRFVDLRAGDYSAEVRASLDGINWTREPARLAFEVLGPWYLRPWALALFTLVASGLLYAAYRARVGVLVRLERQRTQIAMDLHDEMGSGLGSIGILSGIAAQDDPEGIDRQDLAKKIAATAGELGNSLTEIVWALKPGTYTLEALGYHVAERAGRLFPNDEPAFVADFPAHWPRVELSLALRRNLFLIASEALHNVARHANAKRVTFGLAPLPGRLWRLWIADDGSGIGENGGDPEGSGMGLSSMRRRAEEIGAQISWTTCGEKGTTVSVVFNSRADARRVK